MLPDAVRAGADVLLTGEVRFHDYLAAQAQGLALVLPGHYATERCGVEDLAASSKGGMAGRDGLGKPARTRSGDGFERERVKVAKYAASLLAGVKAALKSLSY